jgi:hypothetical protein
MQYTNGRDLVKARDVAKKLGVSISWVIQHAAGKRKPYLPAVKMGLGLLGEKVPRPR